MRLNTKTEVERWIVTPSTWQQNEVKGGSAIELKEKQLCLDRASSDAANLVLKCFYQYLSS